VGSLEDDVVVVLDGDGGRCEGDIASGITKLPDGKEGLCGKFGNNVTVASLRRETRNGKAGLMCGMQNGTRGGVHGNWGMGRALVADWCGRGKEM